MPFSLEPTALQILCDALGDGVLLVDEDSKVGLVNEAAARLLNTGEAALLGKECEDVMATHVGLAQRTIDRLIAGEVVHAAGYDGTGSLRLQRLVLPPSGAWPRSRSREVPSVIIIRDVQAAVPVQTPETLLSKLSPQDSGVASASAAALMGHDGIVLQLHREVVHCHREGVVLSIILFQAPADVEPRRLGRKAVRLMEERWSIGVLDVDEQPELRGERPTNVAAPLDDEHNWLLIVLPGTAPSDAYAATLRLRNHLSAFVDGTTLAFGVAALEPGVSWCGGEDPVESGQTLLERAYLGCIVDAPDPDEPRRFADTLVTSIHSL